MVKVAPEDQFIVYSRLPIPEGTLTPARNLTIQTVPGENDRIWSMKSLPEAARTNGADLLHVQYSVPPRCHCPVVSTIHDISFRLHPNWFPLKHRLLLNLSTPIALRKAARVITVSHSSLKDMKAIYGRLAERVRAVPNGVGEEFLGAPPTPSERASSKQIVASKLGIDVPFVLAVGVLQPRKNLPMLTQAFVRAQKQFGFPHHLVFAGKIGWATEQKYLNSLAEKVSVGSSALLDFLGYVEDELVPTLYEACELFVHPALYEGFGLTPLEAMARGAATLVSDAPALPEIVGDAARIVSATSVQDWAKSIGEILTDPSELSRLRLLGPARAAQFSWHDSALSTLAVYREALSEKR